MASLGESSLRVHITWDTEPTEEAKAFVRAEVVRALQELFEGQSWFAELVQERVTAYLERDRKELARAMGMKSGGL